MRNEREIKRNKAVAKKRARKKGNKKIDNSKQQILNIWYSFKIKMSMIQYIKQESELRNRFVQSAHNNFSGKVMDLSDFKDGLFKYLNLEKKGEGANANMDEMSIRELFLSDENRMEMRDNLTDKEFTKMFVEIERSDSEIVRRPGIVKAKEVKVYQVPKEIKIKGYGNTKSYVRSKSAKWTPAQTRFLRVRKVQNISRKQIIQEYTEHFEDKRTQSSIGTKLYRL